MAAQSPGDEDTVWLPRVAVPGPPAPYWSVGSSHDPLPAAHPHKAAGVMEPTSPLVLLPPHADPCLLCLCVSGGPDSGFRAAGHCLLALRKTVTFLSTQSSVP